MKRAAERALAEETNAVLEAYEFTLGLEDHLGGGIGHDARLRTCPRDAARHARTVVQKSVIPGKTCDGSYNLTDAFAVRRSTPPTPMSPSCLVVTDLDGTLLDSASRLSERNRRTLETLGRSGVVRTVATGRSLYSARLVMREDFPVDYLAFSSGAGIVSWKDGRLLRTLPMDPTVVSRLVSRLRSLALDFMVQHAAPDTHCFHFVRSSGHNADFERRIERYDRYSQPWRDQVSGEIEVSQFVVIEPPGSASHLQLLAGEFEDVHVVRTTSPLDHASTWIELFPAGVSKAHASDWLRVRHAIDPARTIAVGNDYNDLDMLEWAERACVVSNAPASMRARYDVVRANDDDGFTEAVSSLLDDG